MGAALYPQKQGRRAWILSGPLFLLIPGHAAAQTTPAFQPPTATEIFHLRSECVALANKILEDNAAPQNMTQSVASHYDPVTNRCYVELIHQTANYTDPDQTYLRILFDGQTSQQLAATEIRQGFTSGSIEEKLKGPDTYEDATAYMDEKMGDDHNLLRKATPRRGE